MTNKGNFTKLQKIASIVERAKVFRHSDIFRIASLSLGTPDGDWCDFVLEDNSPVKFKIIHSGTNDSINAEQLLYALTGTHIVGARNWDNLIFRLAERIDWEGDSDYYFIILDSSTGECFATSMMRLDGLRPSANKPPFQSSWRRKNCEVERPREEQIKYLIDTFGRSLRLRAIPYQTFLKVFSKAKP